LSSNLTAQTKYPYEAIRGKDTTVTLLKSQAVYLNQTIAKQREKINEYKITTDSLQKSNKELDSLFFEVGKAAVYYKFEAEKLQIKNAKLSVDKRKRTMIDVYMTTVWTLVGAFGIHSIITR
jgi:pyruvate/2-oxoglutarate dehydrogenase complex dihydrolipoamide dehydrogenase (E3) component